MPTSLHGNKSVTSGCFLWVLNCELPITCFLEQCPWSKPTLGQHAEIGGMQRRGLPDDSWWYVASPILTSVNVTALVTSSDSCCSLLLGYLKLWQLSKPLLASFDAIFVDEAQDCTPGDKLSRTSRIHRNSITVMYEDVHVLQALLFFFVMNERSRWHLVIPKFFIIWLYISVVVSPPPCKAD